MIKLVDVVPMFIEDKRTKTGMRKKKYGTWVKDVLKFLVDAYPDIFVEDSYYGVDEKILSKNNAIEFVRLYSSIQISPSDDTKYIDWSVEFDEDSGGEVVLDLDNGLIIIADEVAIKL